MELPGMLLTRRKELGINQATAAAQLGVSQATFSRWENGDDVPSSNRIEAIATWLGQDPRTVLAALYAGSSPDDLEARLMAKFSEVLAELERLRQIVEGPPPPAGA